MGMVTHSLQHHRRRYKRGAAVTKAEKLGERQQRPSPHRPEGPEGCLTQDVRVYRPTSSLHRLALLPCIAVAALKMPSHLSAAAEEEKMRLSHAANVRHYSICARTGPCASGGVAMFSLLETVLESAESRTRTLKGQPAVEKGFSLLRLGRRVLSSRNREILA